MNIGCKKGVSNWTFVFENKEILVDTVQSEQVTYNCDETTEIIINNALLVNELLSLFRKGNKIKKVIQEFQMVGLDGEKEWEKWEYNDVEIKEIFITSQHDEYSGVSLLMCNKQPK